MRSSALKKLMHDPLSVISMVVIVFYFTVAILAFTGVLANDWQTTVGSSYAEPSSEAIANWMGTDIFGRSVFWKLIQGTKIAVGVGLISALLSIPIGILLGALSGYFGGKVDSIIVWFYTTLSSIPNIMLLLALTYALGKGFSAVVIALTATSWIGLTRVLRAEFMKHKEREYVLAAKSLGASNWSRMVKHILPNVMHFVILNFSTQFMLAIKAEVILSFLGLGIQGQPSWGVMIDDAKLELSRGVWWQLAAASVAMFFIILALNIFGDALRDALDPKAKSKV